MGKNSLFNKLKIWLMSKIKGTKQITSGKPDEELKHKESSLDKYKSQPLYKMTNDEINRLLSSGYEPYSKKDITEEILVRIGGNKELARKVVDNKRVNAFFNPHIGNGKLVTRVDGQVIYEDDYKHQGVGDSLPIEERTTIIYKDGAIVIKTTEGYDYFGKDSLDRNPAYQVEIRENDYKGITVETIEKEAVYGHELTAKVVFDDHNVEVGKQIQMYLSGSDQILCSKMWRDAADPLSVHEVINDKRGDKRLEGKGMVNLRYPERLYSCYIHSSTQQEIEWDDLRRREPKAAAYFSSLQEEKGKEE